jgi:hypothetical protein
MAETALAPGSSLGGARPKATIQDVDGSLWIAKFPSKHDDHNSGAWEMTAHELANRAGKDRAYTPSPPHHPDNYHNDSQ